MLATKHGRKMGLVRHLHARSLLHGGLLRGLCGPAPVHPQGRTVFVCKGNIARSAYAAARARQLGFDAVASAGLEAGPGAPADTGALEAAQRRGVDLRAHRARRVEQLALAAHDRIFVFELWHAKALEHRYPGQVYLLGAWASPPRPHIEDPYGRSPAYFDECFRVIDASLQALLREDLAASAPAVYVDQADSLGSIAVIRALGQAGYRVHAAADRPGALGARSRYAFQAAVHPPTSSPEFAAWLASYVHEHEIAAVVPSESLVIGLGERLAEFHHLMPAAESPHELHRGLSKYELFASALDHGLTANLPPLRLYDFTRDEQRAHGELHYPVFLKTDALYARNAGRHGKVLRVNEPDDLEPALRAAAREYSRAVVQAYAPGQGVGANFVLWDGDPLAEFMHQRLHEVPYTGGPSSLRAGFEHAAIRADALARIRALGWRRGPVMVEYRLDRASGAFYLLEMNTRFWGSLHLPYYAGVDFPGILLHRFLQARGYRCPEPAAPGTGSSTLACRHLPGEVQHCWSVLKSRQLSMPAKLKALGNLLTLSLDPRVKGDLSSFPGDRGLFFRALGRFARAAARALGLRLRLPARTRRWAGAGRTGMLNRYARATPNTRPRRAPQPRGL